MAARSAVDLRIGTPATVARARRPSARLPTLAIDTAGATWFAVVVADADGPTVFSNAIYVDR